HIWGVSHSPGYPLYTILVGLIERIPIPPIFIFSDIVSAPAWRANFLSAIFATLAIGAMFALIYELTENRIAAFVSAGSLAFGKIFWWHSEITENDTLTALLLILILFVAVRWVREKRSGDPYLLALLLGLGFSHHQSLVLFLPAIIIYLYINRALGFGLQKYSAIIGAFILGLLPLIYLPLVNYRTPEGPVKFVNEKEYAEIISESPGSDRSRITTESPFEYFTNFIGRGVYGKVRSYTQTESDGEKKTNSADVFGFYVNKLFSDFNPFLVLIGLLGLFTAWRAPPSKYDPKLLSGRMMLVIAWGIYLIVIVLFPSGDILGAPKFNLDTAGPGLMLPLEVLWATLVGIGSALAFNVLLKIPNSGKTFAKIFAVVLFCALIVNYFSNRSFGDRSRDTIAHEYGINVLDSCPENAILVTGGHEYRVLTYLRYVHPDTKTGENGYRSDIDLEDVFERIESFSKLRDIPNAMSEVVRQLASDFPDREIDMTFFAPSIPQNLPSPDYVIARRGILFSLINGNPGDEFIETQTDLAARTFVKFYQPKHPDEYLWDFCGGNAIVDRDLRLPDKSVKYWSLEDDLRWRISEMLLFYASDALLNHDNSSAIGYLRQLVMVEPDNASAREQLESIEN
ncbi:MAG: DUF2723 domain-containing protein, partial [bacterium]